MKFGHLRMHDKLECNGVLWQVVQFDKKQLGFECEQKCAKLRDYAWNWDRWFTRDEIEKMFTLVE